MKNYDYIFIGAGCAGLSLLMRLMDDHAFASKKVLLIDKNKKESNDRTWCYWEKESGYFESIVHKRWSDLVVKNGTTLLPLNMNGYVYKMIRGTDFYEYCFKRIAQFKNIDYRFEEVTGFTNNNGAVTITTGAAKLELRADFVFSSVFEKPALSNGKHYLLQHFKGWMIHTKMAAFNPGQALLMDFSVDQNNNPAAFAYVMPLSATKALVEYTVFSGAVLNAEVYDRELKHYIENALGLQDYFVEHIEFGVIPMTNHRFPVYKDGIVNLGTAGGQTKASTGYTFQFIQKQAAHLAEVILAGGKINNTYNRSSVKFGLYDSILLSVLVERKMSGGDIFMRLFQKVPAWLIFKFLDNETPFREELKILSAMPSKIFLPAAVKEISDRNFPGASQNYLTSNYDRSG